MDLDQARQFVRSNHRAVLATGTSSGRVQQTPVLVAVDDEGRFTISSRETAYKVRNLRADPWAQVCVFTDKFFGQWIFIEGTAEVVSLPDAMPLLEDYYRNTAGEHDDWDAYREAMREQKRVLVRIHGHRAGPDRRG